MEKKIHEGNYLVYLDLSVGEEKVGRVIIELFKHITPKTAENFRALCTGENGIGTLGKNLHFLGSPIHKVIPQFMIQGGDITQHNGRGGESIYGAYFPDENFRLKHKFEGQISLANTGRPNTNNSQFFITLAPCPHLDGKNVVFGRVRGGFGVCKEVSMIDSENDKPIEKVIISACGELTNNDDCDLVEHDGSLDIYPPFPNDWNTNPNSINIDKMEEIIRIIKNRGNDLFRSNNIIEANRRYKKALRYIKWFNQSESPKEQKHFQNIFMALLLNLAAVQLQLNNFRRAIHLCNDILKLDPNNAKALYRRGHANTSLQNFEIGLLDYEKALSLEPNDKRIIRGINFVKEQMRKHLDFERITYAKMFQIS